MPMTLLLIHVNDQLNVTDITRAFETAFRTLKRSTSGHDSLLSDYRRHTGARSASPPLLEGYTHQHFRSLLLQTTRLGLVA